MIVCKYKFDKSIYSNLIPIFNDGYNGYTVSDEIDSENSNHIIRTIECDTLPTLIRFGNSNTSSDTTAREHSLLYVYEVAVGTNIITGYCMFRGCKNLSNIEGCDKWDTSSVTNMSNMFYGCKLLTSLDLSNFDTSNVSKMDYMFYNCKLLTSLDVSKWDTSKVIDMNCMFAECISLTSLDVSNWNTSNVTIMYGMFYNCAKFTELDVSNFDISKAINMGSMFGVSSTQDSQLKILNINNINIDTSKSLDDRFMIYQLNLEKLYLNDLDTLNSILQFLPDRTGKEVGKLVTSLRNETPSETLTILTTKNWEIVDLVAQYRYDANTYENLIPEFNTEFSSDKYEIHDSVSEIVINGLSYEDGKDITAGGALVDEETMHRSLYINAIPNVTYKTENGINIAWYDKDKKFISYVGWTGKFMETKLTTAPSNARFFRITQNRKVFATITAKLITRSIESVNGDLPTLMRFGYKGNDTENHEYNGQGMSLLKIIDLNTKELTDCYRMFKYCKRVESIKANWNTSNVTDMNAMFFVCANLSTLDLSNFDTSKVTIMNTMFRSCNKLTSLDVSNFNTSKVADMYRMFYDCNNLTSLDLSNFDTKNVTNMYAMFQNCTKLTSLDVSNFNTSKVTDMGYMFQNCNNLTSLNVSNFDTNKVTSMRSMFYGCCALTTIGDLSNWNIDSVNNMSRMFEQCNALVSVNVASWNLSNVTDISYMFANCVSLLELNVSNWNTKKVATLCQTFYNCRKLTSLDVSNWDTNNVNNMNGTFQYCQSLTSLDVSNWDTSKVISMNGMFYTCYNLTSLDVSNFDTSKVNNMDNMFNNCQSLTILNLNNWDTNNVITMGHMFYNNINLTTLDISNFNINNVKNINNFIAKNRNLRYMKCNNLEIINRIHDQLHNRIELEQGALISNAKISEETIAALASKNWTVVSSDTLTKVAEYVYDSNTWNSLIPEFNSEFVEYFIDDVEDENGLVTRTISSMGKLPTLMRFGSRWIGSGKDDRIKSLSLISVEKFNITSITNFNMLFRYCNNLTTVNTLNWDTSNIKKMEHMFAFCNKLTSLDVSNWNTSKVTSMYSMFHDCQSLTSLDLSNFNTSEVNNMRNMFTNCYKLTSLDVSNFDTSKVTDMNAIFVGTPLLTDIGMLYCTPSTINTIASALPTTPTRTIWVKDIDINKLTSVSGVEFKEYKENSVMINLSSPLLKGDRIEVVDGKLCHYHKMGKVVLGYHDGWIYGRPNSGWNQNGDAKAYYLMDRYNIVPNKKSNTHYCFADKMPSIYGANIVTNVINENCIGMGHADYIVIRITDKIVGENNSSGFKQWLSENPITVIYELAKPYYEDITPLQSDIVLETYLESNLDICTDLPIKTNVSYITNVPSLSTLSMRATEMKESDNIIANLTNMLDNEINE